MTAVRVGKHVELFLLQNPNKSAHPWGWGGGLVDVLGTQA